MKNFMKKTALAALAALMVLSAASCGKTAADGSETTTAANGGSAAAEPIVVQTNAYFAPFEYFDGNDIVGVDIDIMNKVAAKMNTTVEFQNVDFSVIVDNVSAGKLCDCGAAGITITEARKQQVDFSVPYYESIQYVIYKEGTVNTTKAEDGTEYILWNDLAGKKIGVQETTTGDIYASSDFGEDNVIRYSNGAVAVEALKAGKVDCVIIDNEPAKAYVAANEGLKILETSYADEDYAIAVSKDNPELKDAIDAALKELIADGSLQKIVDKYIPA